MRLSCRRFLQISILTAGMPGFLFAARPQALSGRLLGMTTLDSQANETTALFSLSLTTGDSQFSSLGDYLFGDNLEALGNGDWITIPYGDDSQGCLTLNADGVIQQKIAAPSGMGFGGHDAVLQEGRHVVLHFNQTDRPDSSGGEIVIADTHSGKIVKRRPSPLIHAHDILLSRNEHIIISDDGAIETDLISAPLLMNIINPALY